MLILLLIGVIYGIYRYQQQILNKPKKKKNKLKNKKLKQLPYYKNTVKDNDDITMDNISQFSLKSKDDSFYQQDSLWDSLNEEYSFDNESKQSTGSFLYK